MSKHRKEEGYYGRGETFPFGSNVVEVEAGEVRNMTFDVILFQTNKNYLVDQYEILSEEQRRLPRVYVEHDPPRAHPTDTHHVMDDPDVVMVHVTHYNKLMWWNGARVVKVIEHGVPRSGYEYSGELNKGIVVINHLHQRGRLLGADVFEEVSRRVPLELIGMGTAQHGGCGEVLHPQLPAHLRRFRFFFNPIRYTSMGLAVCEAMMLGMPIVALSTTEYPGVLQDGVTGFISNDIDYLASKMQLLLANRKLAATLGRGARRVAEERFDIHRFTRQWEEAFWSAIHTNMSEHEKNSIYQ